MNMNKILFGALAAIGPAGLPAIALAQAQPAAAGMSQAGLEGVSAVLDKYMAEGGFPGSVTVIHRNGHLAYVSARGYQDIAKKSPMQRDTIFAIASMTKPITAAAAMVLVDDGKLKLDGSGRSSGAARSGSTSAPADHAARPAYKTNGDWPHRLCRDCGGISDRKGFRVDQ